MQATPRVGCEQAHSSWHVGGERINFNLTLERQSQEAPRRRDFLHLEPVLSCEVYSLGIASEPNGVTMMSGTEITVWSKGVPLGPVASSDPKDAFVEIEKEFAVSHAVHKTKKSWVDLEEGQSYISQVVYLAIVLCVWCSAWISAATTVALIFPVDRFGTTQLMIFFFAFAFGSVLSPFLLARLHPKWCIVIGCVTIFFWVATLLSESIGLVIFSSLVSGMGFAVMWVAVAAWMGRSRARSLGNNLFWSIFFFSWLLGGVVGGLVLQYLPIKTYQGIMTLICGVGASLSIFVRALPPVEGEVLGSKDVRGLFRPLLLLSKRETLFVLPGYMVS